MLLHHLHMDSKTTESQNMFSKAVQALNKNTLDQLPKLLRVNKFPHAEKRKIMWYLPVYGEEAFGDRLNSEYSKIGEKDISEMPLCLRPRWRRYRKKFLELQDEEKDHEAAIARVRTFGVFRGDCLIPALKLKLTLALHRFFFAPSN